MRINLYQIIVIVLLITLLFGDLSKIKKKVQQLGKKNLKNYRKKGNWTHYLWFWKPMLYLHELFSFLKYFYEKLKVNIMIKHYFKEFKNRSFLLITTWISCIIVTFHYKDNLIYVMIEPYIKYQNSNFYFIYTEISEPFHTNLYLIIFVSNQITCFMLLYHLLGFVKPGLYKK